MTVDSSVSIKKANTLLGTQFLADFGDQITSVLLALCLLDISKSTKEVGLVYFITTVGYVVFTLAGGLLGDRLSKRNVLFCSDIGRGLTVLILILAVREKSILLIYAVSFLFSFLGSLHRPVKVSIWAESIPTSFLERYNSLSELSVQTSTVLVPLIAAFFVEHALTTVGFSIDAGVYFTCAIIFARIVSSKSNPLSAVSDQKRDFLVGFKLIAKRAELSKYISYDAIQMIGYGAFNATFLVLAQRDFAWSKAHYSYHLSIVALFTVTGALLGATRYMQQVNPSHKLIFCALTSALAIFVALKIHTFPLSSLLVGICDGLTVLTMAVTRTKVQLMAKNTYPDFLSSIIAARYVTIKAATLLGTGTCLLMGDFISLKATLEFFAIFIALSAVPFFFGNEKLAVAPATSISK